MPVDGNYSCPSDSISGCGSLDLPPTKVADCPSGYGAFESEICDIWITSATKDASGAYDYPKPGDASPGTPPEEDWRDPANYLPGAWTPPTENPNNKIDHLVVIGDKPLPEFNDIVVAKRISIPASTTHTVNIDVTDFAIEVDNANGGTSCRSLNYDYIRALQSRPTVAIWFRTIDGLMFGGQNGIVCDVISAGHVLGRGEGTLLTGQVIFSWESPCDPEMAMETDQCTYVAPVATATSAPKEIKTSAKK